MNCDECRQELSEFGMERLAAGRQAAVQVHLQECPHCASEFAALRELWNVLDKELVPDQSLQERFQARLDAQVSMKPIQKDADTMRRTAPAAPWWFLAWWPTRPVWAFSYSVLLVGGGLVSGQLLPAGTLGLPAQSGQEALSEERLLQICPVRDPRLDSLL